MNGLGTSGLLGVPPSMKIKDTRKVDRVTGKPVMDKSRLDRNADPDMMKRIIHESKRQGVDPYTALAMAHQETGLTGEGDNEGNPFHLLDNSSDDLVAAGVKMIKDKMQYATKLGKKNEADQIQAFNGYGKVGARTEGRQNMLYGIDVSKQPIDMSQTPVYGKRIMDIRDNILKQNPDVVKMVEGETGNDPKLTAPLKTQPVQQGLSTTQLLGF